MIFGWLRRRRNILETLESRLRQTKKIIIDNVEFEIKKVGIDEHLAGLNVILRFHEQYGRPEKHKTVSVGQKLEDQAKLKKFLRDILVAGVVSPKLTLKDKPEDGEINVDQFVSREFDLANMLTYEILKLTYGKKK